MNLKRIIPLMLAGALTIGLAGCDKVTRENYDKIADGMTLREVEAILGKGEEKVGVGGAIGDFAASGKVYRWGSDEKFITVTFVNDKVVLKLAHGL